MPEPAVRPSEEKPRTSQESERRRMIRNSYQSTKSVHTGGTEPIIEEVTSPEPSRPESLTPSARGPSQWQPPQDTSLAIEPAPLEHYSPRPSIIAADQQSQNRSTYDRNVSGEYPGTPQEMRTPIAQRNDDYFTGRPRQKTSALSQDSISVRGSLPRYAPIPGAQPARRPVSILSTRRNPWEVYDPDVQPPSNEGSSGTPSKARRKRRTTSFYVVREGGSDKEANEVLRLPFADWIRGDVRSHFVAFLGEFVGTCMFLWFAFAGTIVANIGAQKSADNTTTNATVGFSPIVNLYVAISFGFSLLVNVWIFFRVSGGLFNPAVTLGMVITKTIGYARGILLFIAQILGAIFASFLVKVMFPTDFNIRTTLADNTSLAQGVFIEMVLTAELVFTVFMLAKEKHKATYMAPIGIGMALFIAQIVGVFFTGGSLNPARSLGPCVIAGKFDPEHWIYWVGPCCGTLVAYAFYRFIKMLEYELANPGAEHNAEEAEAAACLKRAESFV